MNKQNQPIFKINAGQILAKLHLAGIQACDTENIINSGIVGYRKGATPDNPGNTMFDLNNKSKKYELAIYKDMEYLDKIDEKNDKELIKLNEELKKSGISDDKVKKIEEDIEKRKEEIEKENKKREDEFKKIEEDHKKGILESMKLYTTAFGGKELAAKITEDKLSKVTFSGYMKLNSLEKYIKDYKIQSISKSDYKKEMRDIEDDKKKNPDEKIVLNIGYKIAYDILSDTL